MPLDQEFLDLISQYTPSDEPGKEISYEEATLKNTKDLIAKFEDMLATCDQDNVLLREYFSNLITQYKKQGDEPVKTFSKEEIVDMLDSLKNSPEFDMLPMPVAYLEKLARDDDAKKDELSKIKLMETQVKERNEARRLENYKNYLMEKMDRKKLDKKFGK